MIASDPGILLGALEVSKLRKTTREKINSALLNARHEDLLYGMIVAEGRLVSVIRPRRHSLHPPGTPHHTPFYPLSCVICLCPLSCCHEMPVLF